MGGIFYDAHDRLPWIRLGWALLGLLVICSWTAANMFFCFFILKKTGQLRVEDEVIASDGGLDKHEHGEFAYVLEPHLYTPSGTPRQSMSQLAMQELLAGMPAPKSEAPTSTAAGATHSGGGVGGQVAVL